ncbi:hypothetical protein KGY77_05395, partial [Candidatus Bipolaricaulota bacterium]|nr:hypothetical protein [Candidatus Bipolaricaulota bacterium]
MTKQYLVGTDIGTQGTKTVVVDTSGEVISSGSSFYSVEQPFPSWAQQWPEVWEKATYESLREAVESSDVDS